SCGWRPGWSWPAPWTPWTPWTRHDPSSGRFVTPIGARTRPDDRSWLSRPGRGAALSCCGSRIASRATRGLSWGMTDDALPSAEEATANHRVAYTTCPLCEATCGLALTVRDDRITAVRGDADDVFS